MNRHQLHIVGSVPFGGGIIHRHGGFVVRGFGLVYDLSLVKTETEILAQGKSLLRDQRHGPDIRNAAVFT